MNKIVISGYYGFNNAGDEAVLYSIVHTIRAIRSDVEFTVLSNDPAGTMADLGVKAVNRWKPTEVWRALKEADLLISGGGSLLQDVTGSRSIIYYLGIVQIAHFLGKPVMFYANGIGPVNRARNRFLVAQVANAVDTITLRDAQSLEDLQEMGVHKPLSRVTADPALGIDGSQIDLEVGGQILRRMGVDPQKPILGIAIRQWKGISNYFEVVARVADDMVQRGWQVVLLPMHYPKDLEPSFLITKQMQFPGVILREKLKVVETLSIIGNCSLMIGMRLHALIMAAVMGVPFVGISYDPKVERFLELTGQRNAGTPESVGESGLLAEVNALVENQEQVKAELAEHMSGLAEKARESAVLALSLLKTPMSKK